MSSQTQDKKKFKILALDGGGIRGVVTAKILQEFEKQLKLAGIEQPLNQYFDLIAGTSTGSILAAGLITGRTIEEIIDIYKNRGKEIFKKRWNRLPYISTKYSNEGLITVLKEELGEKTLREVGKKPGAELLILAYDTFYRNTTLFGSRYFQEKDDYWFNDKTLWEICVSSASAPTFFPPYKFTYKQGDETVQFPHIDGGISVNCPSLAALKYVLSGEKKIKQSIDNISILSIGTGRTTKPFQYQKIKGWNNLNWGIHIPDIFMGGQIQITTNSCEDILNAVNPNSYFRFQFNINEPFQDKKEGSNLPVKIDPEPKNYFIGEHINEAMDDASAKTIDQLLRAASKYVKHREIQEDIQNFITSHKELVKF